MTRLALLLFLGASAIAAPAQDKPSQATSDHTVTFSFDKKPWGEVIDWFRTESGLVYAGNITPTGSITIKTSPGKKYTIPQVVDLLNELLEPRYVLIRREQTFTVWPADDPIEPQMVRQISDVSELAKLGRTEIIQLVESLGPLTAEETVPPLRFLLSSFGKISAFGANSIIVRDKAVNVQRVVDAIAKLKGDMDQDRFGHACKFVRASAAAESLKILLGTDTVIDLTSPAPYPTPYPVGRTDRIVPRAKAVRISVQEPTNTVLITGPADKLALARKFLREDIDTGAPGTELHTGGEPTFREYPVAPGTAATVATTLMAQFKNSSVVVVASASDRIMAFGYPMDHAAIGKQVLAGDPDARGDPVTEIIPLFSTDPKTMAALMTKMFPANNGLPLIEPQYDGAKTGVLVRAGGEQVKRIKKEIELVDNPEGKAGGFGVNRVFLPGTTSSGILAECLADMVKQAGRNDVIILDPTAPPEKQKASAPMPRKRKPRVEFTNQIPPMPLPQTPDRIDPGMGPGTPQPNPLFPPK